MGDMPEVISKGPIFVNLDGTLSDGTLRKALLDDLLNLSDKPGSNEMVALAEKYGVAKTGDEASHLRDDWFGTWWSDAQPVQEVVRRGLIEAIQLAEAQSLPVDSYWICHTGHGTSAPSPGETGGHGEVEITVCWSARQVTLLFHTPETPPRNEPPLTPSEPIKVVKRRGGKVVTLPPSEQP